MLKNAVIALLAIALIGSATTVVVWSQAQTAEVEVRVRAKQLDDGRTEFAVQQREDGGWSDSLFRSNPRLTANPVIDRWYSSRGVTASAPVDVAQLAAAARPVPPTDWTPLGDTGGDVRIDLTYSVEPDVISDSLTTIVTTRAIGSDYGGEYIKLSLVCDGGDLNLVADDDEFRFSNAPIDVTLRFDGEEPETYSWPYLRDPVIGYSPLDDRTFIQRLRVAERVAVQIKSDTSTTAQLVDLAGFFQTPAQPNIDHCGRSISSGVPLLGDTDGVVNVDITYAVTVDAANGDLTTVIETWVTDESYSTSRVYLVCDRDRLDVVLYIVDNTYTTPSWTPTTTVQIDDGAAEEFRWPYIFGVENGISPDDDLAFIGRIRTASSLNVRVNRGTAADGTAFALTGLFSTRAQGNIDFCGQY